MFEDRNAPCFDFTEKTEYTAASAESMLLSCENVTDALMRDRKAAVQRCKDALAELLDAVTRHTPSIPQPHGIFVGDRERKPAYAATARLLCAVEPAVHRLRSSCAALLALEDDFAKAQYVQTQAAALLEELEHASAATSPPPIDMATWHNRFNKSRERYGETAALFAPVRESVAHFCSVTLSDFSTRIAQNADMEHEGAACNPTAILRLLGEFRVAIEQTLHKVH